MEQGQTHEKNLDGRRAAASRVLEDVYARQSATVQKSLWRFGVHNPADQEELTQEVFRLVTEKLDEFDPERGEMDAWVTGFAWRAAVDFRRVHGRRGDQAGEPLERIAAESRDPEEQSAAAEVRRIVLDIIDTAIDEDRRALFAMAEIEGHSNKDIAAALGLRITTVEGRLRLAREQFRAEVRRREKARRLSRDDVRAMPLPLLLAQGGLRDLWGPAREPDAPRATARGVRAVLRAAGASAVLHGAAIFVAGVVAGGAGVHLLGHGLLGRSALLESRSLPPPVVTVAEVVATLPSPPSEAAPVEERGGAAAATHEVVAARSDATAATDPPKMDKEIVQRIRQQDKIEEREKLAQRHRTAYGDSPSAEERDAAVAEGAIASGSVDAARAAVAAFRTRYPGSIYQVRLEGLLARRQPADVAKGGVP